MARSTPEWQKGFNDYIKSTFTSTYKGETAPCPCSRCCCMSYRTQSEVEKHLVDRGFAESFIPAENNNVEGSVDEDKGFGKDGATSDGASMKDLVSTLIRGAIHGEIVGKNSEEPNDQAKSFFKLLKEAQKELYPGCKEATKVSFIVTVLGMYCRMLINYNYIDKTY
jgi:hypothetical protein